MFHWYLGQEIIALEFFDGEFHSSSAVVEFPGIEWRQLQVCYDDVVTVLAQSEQGKLLRRVLGNETPDHDELIFLVARFDGILELGCLYAG